MLAAGQVAPQHAQADLREQEAGEQNRKLPHEEGVDHDLQDDDGVLADASEERAGVGGLELRLSLGERAAGDRFGRASRQAGLQLISHPTTCRHPMLADGERLLATQCGTIYR